MARKQLQNLTEPMYYVLLCLRTPLHGYGIMQRIDEITKGRLKVGPGTLYNLISRFENEKIVEIFHSIGMKKTYQLTEKGMKIFEEERKRLKLMVMDGEIRMEELDEK